MEALESVEKLDISSYGKGDLMLIDLDETLWIYSDKFMRNVNENRRDEVLYEVSKRSGDQILSFIFKNAKYCLTEKHFVAFIEALKGKGCRVLGFTARMTGYMRSEHEKSVQDMTEDVSHYFFNNFLFSNYGVN